MLRAVAFALSALLLGAAGVARADGDPVAQCSLRVIQAHHDGERSMDPAITKLRPWLEREPFDDWKKFELVHSKEMTLHRGGSDSEVLPNGKKATVTYVEHLHEKDKHRVRIRFTLENGPKKEFDIFYILDEGGTYVHAAQKKQTQATEMIILGVSCEIPH
jgi:hypothetical protein